ncbi:radical SAM protein [Thermodesulfobacteriota bacterium]
MGYSFFPIAIFLAVNNKCNLFCKMCDIGQRKTDTSFYKNMKTDEETLSIDDWRRFIDDVTPWRPSIDIVGVEPLMYRDLGKLLEYIRSKGLVSHLTTNGTLLKKRAEELAHMDLEGLFVSIDGFAQLHDKIRGVPGTFDKAVEGIEAFLSAQKRIGGSTTIHITTTISPPNHHRLYDIAVALGKLPVNSLTMNHFSFLPEKLVDRCQEQYGHDFVVKVSSLGGVELEDVDVEVLWAEMDRVKAYAASSPFPMNIAPSFSKDEVETWYQPPFLSLRPQGYCNVPWTCAGINSNGDVINIFRCPYPTFGNIRKIPFSQIWNNKKYVTFRRSLRKDRFLFCTRCRRSFNTTP